MIKLIAVDMDGTLLNDKKELPKELPALLAALRQQGILFVPTSGRDYRGILSLFSEFPQDHFAYVCMNGHIVVYQGEYLYTGYISDESARYLMQELRKIPSIYILLRTQHYLYYEDKDPRFLDVLQRIYPDHSVLQYTADLTNCIGKNPVCFISSLDQLDVMQNSYPKLSHLAERFSVLNSGEGWIDITNPNESKGNALKILMDQLNIAPEEVICFGDSENDCSLFDLTPNSYAMKNALDWVKDRANYVTEKSNNENGVISTLKKLLNF